MNYQRVRRSDLESLEHNKYAIKDSRGWAWAFWISFVLGTFSTGSVFAGFLAGSCPAHKACRSRCCWRKIPAKSNKPSIVKLFLFVFPLPHAGCLLASHLCTSASSFRLVAASIQVFSIRTRHSFVSFYDARSFTEKYINTNMHTRMRYCDVYMVLAGGRQPRPQCYPPPETIQMGVA